VASGQPPFGKAQGLLNDVCVLFDGGSNKGRILRAIFMGIREFKFVSELRKPGVRGRLGAVDFGGLKAIGTHQSQLVRTWNDLSLTVLKRIPI
jgi:hypothetical protein